MKATLKNIKCVLKGYNDKTCFIASSIGSKF